jgi:hypothetical protein
MAIPAHREDPWPRRATRYRLSGKRGGPGEDLDVRGRKHAVTETQGSHAIYVSNPADVAAVIAQAATALNHQS